MLNKIKCWFGRHDLKQTQTKIVFNDLDIGWVWRCSQCQHEDHQINDHWRSYVAKTIKSSLTKKGYTIH